MHLKITATICSLIAFVLSLAVLMNYAKYERTLNNLTESRLSFLIQDLRNTLEFGLDIGLDPAAMANAADILAREAAQDPQILSIIVFDDQGQTLYQHIAPNHPARSYSAAVLAILNNASMSVWHPQNLDILVVGTPLKNNFGSTVGGIALHYDRAHYDDDLQQTLMGLIRTALLMLAVASFTILLGVWLLFRGTRQELGQLEIALKAFLDGSRDTPFQPPAERPAECPSATATLYAAAEQKSREFQHRLTNTHQILHQEEQNSANR